ncbi:hypothetical protein IFM89_022360 [Coptis chinensis]|uniref:Uncharacterized protein n=1 Tax=Coptis chinensis TaxID=261450 RepID=A0A835GZA1_9MAGN|nr:hypothetical protein IFM89_022360 [Coptis chinensis]
MDTRSCRGDFPCRPTDLEMTASFSQVTLPRQSLAILSYLNYRDSEQKSYKSGNIEGHADPNDQHCCSADPNDVASAVKMIKRNEIPVDLSGHLHASAQQYDHKTEQVVKVPESLPLKAVASVDQALRQAVSRTVRSPHIHPGEQANEVSQVIQLPSQSLDALPKDKTHTPLKGGHDNLNQAELLQGSGISCLKGAANGDETKDLKLELTPGTSIEIFPDNGTIATVSEAPPDAGSHSVASEIKDKGVEDKQSSVATGSQHVTTQLIAELSKMWEENHVLSDSEIPRKDETSPSNEGP